MTEDDPWLSYLKREVELARAHINDFDAGAKVGNQDGDTTDYWRAQYEALITQFEAMIARAEESRDD